MAVSVYSGQVGFEARGKCCFTIVHVCTPFPPLHIHVHVVCRHLQKANAVYNSLYYSTPPPPPPPKLLESIRSRIRSSNSSVNNTRLEYHFDDVIAIVVTQSPDVT